LSVAWKAADPNQPADADPLGLEGMAIESIT
jgi:hypothetical protein